MAQATRATENLEPIVRRAMSFWTAYQPSDSIHVRDIMGRFLFIGYNVGEAACWHANVVGSTFYLLKIRLPEDMRGRGLGSELYRTIESIAQNLGCREIKQFPSGWTPSGETRLNYLLRRGWLLDPSSHEVMKILSQRESGEKDPHKYDISLTNPTL